MMKVIGTNGATSVVELALQKLYVHATQDRLRCGERGVSFPFGGGGVKEGILPLGPGRRQ